MTIGNPARLTLAVAASVAIHTAVLLPVKVPSGLYVSTPFAHSLLNVRLRTDATPLADFVPDTQANAPISIAPPQEVPSTHPAAPVAGRGTNTSSARSDADPRASVLARATSAPPRSSGEQEAPARPGVRMALPDEVKVYVRRYDAKAEENPNEVIDVGATKYFYFNAPQLRQTAHPLADASPHYPTKKLDYPHGAVVLLLFIDEQGNLEKTLVECANPAFEESAVMSIRNMRFAAARDAHGPVKSYMKVEFRYGLGSPCAQPPYNLQQVVNPAASSR